MGKTRDLVEEERKIPIIEGQLLGVGQTWQDVTASRAAGVTYTNTTGRPIEVFLTLAVTTTSSNSLTITVGGVALFPAGAIYTLRYGFSFIVPPGATYNVTLSAINIGRWTELR